MSTAQVTESQILDALRPIEDPDFRKSIVDLGFIKNLSITGGKVAFSIELTTPACPVKERFHQAAHQAVSALPGVESVDIEMTANTRQPARSQAEDILPGVRSVVAVASGKGGVGKSTVSANLAVALARTGARVGLLDCDVYGPSVPLMFGVSGPPQVTTEQQLVPKEAHGVKLMSIGFLSSSTVIWRGPMVHSLVRQFLTTVLWGELDYLVVDMPPGTGDAALTLTQTAPISGAVIVSTPQEVALIDARKGLQMFQRVQVPVLGIVENMSYFVCSTCDTEHHIFGTGGAARTAEELGVPLIGRVPLQADVVVAGDAGRPTVLASPDSPAGRAFQEISENVVRKLAVLQAEPPSVIGTNITWVNTPA
jgi:ATP-binding protein involved in chromosome partitioning